MKCLPVRFAGVEIKQPSDSRPPEMRDFPVKDNDRYDVWLDGPELDEFYRLQQTQQDVPESPCWSDTFCDEVKQFMGNVRALVIQKLEH
jgi:hypothetical protein